MSPSVWTCNGCDLVLRADPGDAANVEMVDRVHAKDCSEVARRHRGGFVRSARDERAEEEFELARCAA